MKFSKHITGGRAAASKRNEFISESVQPARFTRFARIFSGCFLSILLGVGIQLAGAAPLQASVKLAWDASSDPGIAGYRIHYGVAPAQYTNSIALGKITAATVTGLVNGVTYFFAVTAYNASGTQSLFSNEISYKPAVFQLQMRMTAAHQVVLTVLGQVGHRYDIEATQNLRTWTVIGTTAALAGDSVEFTDANAANFTKRFYRLRDLTP